MPGDSWRAGAFAIQTVTPPGTSITLTLPSSLLPGDLMVVGYAAESATSDTGGQGVIALPSGGSAGAWTPMGAQMSQSTSIAQAFRKIAAAGDAGATLTLSYGTSTTPRQSAALMGAWSGVNTAAPVPGGAAYSQSANATSSVSQVLPVIDTTGADQCWIAGMYLGRAPTGATTWGLSAGWTSREVASPSGGAGKAQGILFDGAAPVSAGPGQGGGIVTLDQASSQNYLFSFAIAPAAVAATARPNVDVTTTGWTPSATVAGGTPVCSLVADSSNATWVTSQTAPTAQVWEAKLPSMAAAPTSFTNVVQFAGGAVSGTVVSQLIQGTTVIATRTDVFSSAPPTVPTALTHALTTGEQAAVTNLADLRIRCTVTAA